MSVSDLFGTLPIRHRIFVSYHHSGDGHYYEIFSRAFHDTYESIFDNSLERRVDSEDPTYVLRRTREHFITGSSCTIVLVGAQTWGRKYVDWEIDAMLEMGHALIGLELPTLPVQSDGKMRVPDRLYDNIASGYAVWKKWDWVTGSVQNLSGAISEAKLKSTRLISNSRDRRYRNA